MTVPPGSKTCQPFSHMAVRFFYRFGSDANLSYDTLSGANRRVTTSIMRVRTLAKALGLSTLLLPLKPLAVHGCRRFRADTSLRTLQGTTDQLTQALDALLAVGVLRPAGIDRDDQFPAFIDQVGRMGSEALHCRLPDHLREGRKCHAKSHFRGSTVHMLTARAGCTREAQIHRAARQPSIRRDLDVCLIGRCWRGVGSVRRHQNRLSRLSNAISAAVSFTIGDAIRPGPAISR